MSVLNKLGIYTANDLLYYFPRKDIDYSTRTRIRDLKEGENTTIFGIIKSVEAFTSSTVTTFFATSLRQMPNVEIPA